MKSISSVLLGLALLGATACSHRSAPAHPVTPTATSSTGFNGTNGTPGQPPCNNATLTGKSGNPGCDQPNTTSATNQNSDANQGAGGTPSR